ncbi:unnamed protein product [Tilletia caries]|uniref:Carboxylesterase type B domain-containing protein n=1 Tax=Tilletia caries TaxID=13290 RepID=A0ABN7J1U9_9BASI|nr:unnamed protein product [Tilletia caries]
MSLSFLFTSTFCRLIGLLVILSQCSAAPHLASRSIGSSSYIIKTTLGPAKGVSSGSGAARFTLPYAQPPLGNLRFANPQAPSSFKNGTASSTSKLGVFVWIPGGSFIGGSATAAGLDASALAVKQNMVVVVLQYRVGLFGFFQNAATLDEANGGAPNGNKVAGNQAVRDVVAALSFIKDNAAALGGNPSAITIVGQSSGAHLVRVLLSTPAASSLFARAALFSDPENYGLSNASQAGQLTDYALEGLSCTTLACARSKSADDILGATYDAFSNAPPSNPSMPVGEPFRPTKGTYIPRSLERGLVAQAVTLNNKPVLFSTVKNEAGSQVGLVFESTKAGATTLTIRANRFPVDFTTAASLIFNAGRGLKAAQSPVYAFNAKGSAADALRAQVEVLGTDGLWRCAVQTNAINAQKAGVVCHEDDIFLIFGNLPSSASTAVKAASAEWQARLGAFVKSGSPNTNTYGGWNAVGSASALNLLVLGANATTGKSHIQQTQRKGACGPSGLWGQSVQFDWQLCRT